MSHSVISKLRTKLGGRFGMGWNRMERKGELPGKYLMVCSLRKPGSPKKPPGGLHRALQANASGCSGLI